MMKFYLGTHMPGWLTSAPANVPLFVSHRRLASRGPLPRIDRPWALDSGGFSELNLYGAWRTTPEEYAAAVARYDRETGHVEWAAPQDWMVEPFMLAKTGLTVAEHQARTVANFGRLTSLWAELSDDECPFMPVLQGWSRADYLECWNRYDDAGISLADYPLVGLGSVCRRQATEEIGDVIAALKERDPDIPLHGFGVKLAGLAAYGHMLESADSMAWSFNGRHDARLPGCTAHKNCANCMTYALRWRDKILAVCPDDQYRSVAELCATTAETTAS
jgi:hypothetical protein